MRSHDGAPQQILQRADALVDVQRAGVQRLLAGKRQQAIGQRRGTARRTQCGVGEAQHAVAAAFDDALFHKLDAGDDAGEQVVEVVGDAAGQLAEGIHLLRLQQLLFGTRALGHLMGQLAGGGGDLLPLGALTVALLGDVLDEHQAQPLCAVGRNLPFGLPRFAVDAHRQGRAPAVAGL